MTTPDLGDVVRRRTELKEKLEAASKAFAETQKPDSDALAACDQLLLMLLNAQNIDSAKTEHGTVYRLTSTSYGVEDWDQVATYVLGGAMKRALAAAEAGQSDEDAMQVALQSPEFGFLVRNVRPDAVKEYLEQNQSLPPGIKSSSVVSARVRKS